MLITLTSANLVPGLATRLKVTGTRYSPYIRISVELAKASRVAETPPSMEFSTGTMARSAEPFITASMASLTVETARWLAFLAALT